MLVGSCFARWWALGVLFGTTVNAASAGTRHCTVKPGGSNATDDVPAIIDAFDRCGKGGTVEFLNEAYYINTVMNISGVENCDIDVKGTLLWSTNITYWLNHSLPVGYQNQSTAWILSGEAIRVNGHGYGTLDGNGDVWYTFINGRSNYPGRPHALTVAAKDSTFEGVRFVRSQMWSLSIINSTNVVFDSIYVNNTSSNGTTSSNTDGADTIYSSHITFTNWVVINGDDSISPKANSTDIVIKNCAFYNGNGIAIGSIGQYKGRFETIERVYAENITFNNTLRAVYFKTWTGEQVGYPPNGGGGGLGFASNLVFEGMQYQNGRDVPLAISQCTTFSGAVGNCTSSAFKLENLTFRHLSGTSSSENVATFQCSAVAPCQNITIVDTHITVASNKTVAQDYLCGNLDETHGFNCTGPVCVGGSADGGC